MLFIICICISVLPFAGMIFFANRDIYFKQSGHTDNTASDELLKQSTLGSLNSISNMPPPNQSNDCSGSNHHGNSCDGGHGSSF